MQQNSAGWHKWRTSKATSPDIIEKIAPIASEGRLLIARLCVTLSLGGFGVSLSVHSSRQGRIGGRSDSPALLIPVVDVLLLVVLATILQHIRKAGFITAPR